MNSKRFEYACMGFTVHMLTVVGSTLHNLKLDGSDVDMKGVFVWDKEVLFGLDKPQDTLEYKNTDEKEWSKLVKELNKSFNLKLEDEDDFTLFEAKKFTLSALKNDSNMLDMLWSKPFYTTGLFKKNFLDNRKLFLNSEMAKSRFRGMSQNCLKLGKKLNKPKDLAKSLQMLYSLEFLLKNKDFNPVLEENKRLEVLEVKKGLVSSEKVEQKYTQLNEKVDFLYEKTKPFESDKKLVNSLLVDLVLNYHHHK